MIVRSWRASAARDQRHRYPEHFATTVLPKLRAVPGFLGAYLLAREVGTEVEFVVQTLWASEAAVASFAGPEPDVAVVDPEAAALLLRHDASVTHHTVLLAPDEPPGSAAGATDRP